MQIQSKSFSLLFKNLLSAGVTLLLFLILFKFYSINDFIDKISQLRPLDVIIILGMGLFFLMASGIELYFYYRIYSGRRINLYDIITLPLVMNLWGHILPFQGSFIYNVLYLKSKYLISIGTNFKAYLFQFACAISLGFLMLLLFKISNNTILPIEYLIYIPIILTPFFYNQTWWMAQALIQKFLPARYQSGNVAPSQFNLRNILFLLMISTAISLIYCVWLFVIAGILNINISFMAIVIVGLLSKIALLFRFTPGNLGINQYTFGGIFALLGLAASAGVSISLYVSASYLIISFTVGIVFNIINLKYISLNNIFTNSKAISSNT